MKQPRSWIRALRMGCALALTGLLMPSQAEVVTLRYATTDGSDSLRLVRQIVDEFEAKHPNIRVRIEPVVDAYAQKLMAMVAANVAPDVARFGVRDYMPLAARGALLPLDEWVERDGIDLSEYYPTAVDLMTMDDQLWVLPRSVSPTGLIFYNKRIFREAGLPYPTPDWTWSLEPRPELGTKCFLWTMEALTKRQPGERTQVHGFAMAWPQLFFETLMLSRGLSMWDDDDQPTRVHATKPEIIELMNMAAALVNEKRFIPSFIDMAAANTTGRDMFVRGRVAMLQTGPWEIRRFRREMTDDWDVVTFPSYVGREPVSLGETNGTGIFASTRHPEEAWKFVRWMSGPRAMTILAQGGMDQPAIRSLALTPGVWLSKDPDTPPISMKLTDQAALTSTTFRFPEYWTPVFNMVGGLYFDVLTGVRTPAESLQRLERDGNHLASLQMRRLDRPPFPWVPAIGVMILALAALIYWVYAPERGRRYTATDKKESRSAYFFLIPWILGLMLTFGPMLFSLILSFAESDMIRPARWAGFGNYTDAIFVNDTTWISFRQTFLFAALSIPLGMMSALGLALLLNQKVRGVPLFRALFYLPSLASGVAMSLIWMRLFNPEVGLINYILYGPDGQGDFLGLGSLLSNLAGTPGEPVNWLGNTATVVPAFVIMGMWGAGGGTIIFLAGLQGISQQYYEAAIIDGANAWKRFKSVTLPLLTPTIFFSLITGVIGALQVFTQAVVMTDGGPDRATFFVMVYLYREAFHSLAMGYASALAWMLFVVILILTVIQLATARRWVYYEGELK